MTIIEFLILSLATWRVSSLLAEEDGPANLLGRLRYALGVRYDAESYAYGTNWISEQITCLWCVSLPVGLAWFLFWLWAGNLAVFVALPFALSTIAILLHSRGIRFRKRS